MNREKKEKRERGFLSEHIAPAIFTHDKYSRKEKRAFGN